MKTILCVIVLLIITPISAVASLAFFDPAHWGGKPTVADILIMAVFGVLTIPVWITYVPTIILTPMAMNWIASNEIFYSIQVWKLLSAAIVVGAVIGIFILSPMIFRSLSEPIEMIFNGVRAGIISGAISFSIIALLYRYLK